MSTRYVKVAGQYRSRCSRNDPFHLQACLHDWTQLTKRDEIILKLVQGVSAAFAA